MLSHNQKIGRWYQHLPGSRLLETEKKLLSRMLKSSTGECFVCWADQDRYELGKQVQFDQTIFLSGKNDFPLFSRGLQVSERELPFASESVDLFFLPHALEFAKDPFSMMKEAQRVLRPGGCLVILNFNPASFWGLGKLYKKNKFPWDGRAMSALYLRCFLKRLDLKVIRYKTDFFRPLSSSPKSLKKTGLLETVGQMCWPFLGAVYVMVAWKEGLEPIVCEQEKKKHKSFFVRAKTYPEPTAHTSGKRI